MAPLLLLSLLACKDDTGDSAVDSAADTGAASDSAAEVAVEVLSVSVTCADGVQAELLSAGWLSGASLQLYSGLSDEGWSAEEQHPFPRLPVDYDPNGAWDRYALSLGPAVESYTPGETSAVDCSADLSWTVRVFDSDGAEADCVSGGAAPDELGCRLLTE